jgi:hypothetical protein
MFTHLLIYFKSNNFQLFPMSESELVHAPMFPDEFNVTEELIFSPKVYNIKQDAGILWQCPGFEYDSSELFH